MEESKDDLFELVERERCASNDELFIVESSETDSDDDRNLFTLLESSKNFTHLLAKANKNCDFEYISQNMVDSLVKHDTHANDGFEIVDRQDFT